MTIEKGALYLTNREASVLWDFLDDIHYGLCREIDKLKEDICTAELEEYDQGVLCLKERKRQANEDKELCSKIMDDLEKNFNIHLRY